MKPLRFHFCVETAQSGLANLKDTLWTTKSITNPTRNNCSLSNQKELERTDEIDSEGTNLFAKRICSLESEHQSLKR
jgi:hypothetical protein